MTTFIRLLDVPVDDKAAALRAAVTGDGAVFECAPEAFAAVPGSPFAYWVSDQLRARFKRLPAFESEGRTARRGPSTCDDFRYLRCSWEVGGQLRHEPGLWHSFAKGGVFSPYYSDIHLLVDWEPRRQTFLGFLGRPGREIEKPESVDQFFRPGLTWPRRTQSGFGMRAMPAGCIFADKGPAAFVAGDDPKDLLALLAITTSAAFAYLVELQMAFGSYEVGVIQRTPVPPLTTDDGRPTTHRRPTTQSQALASLARRAWSLRRALDTVVETSHAFVLPPRQNERVTGLDPAAIAAELAGIQQEIDERAFDCYGIEGGERRRIESGLADMSEPSADGESPSSSVVSHQSSGQSSDADDQRPTTDDHRPTTAWLIGVCFARFDPRLATGERPIPPEPEPFDPLPSRSPGMYPEGDEPADRPDILVDDQGHGDDLIARTRAVAERVKVDAPEHFRAWLAKEFFPLHIKMYSKSRRKAPIYWQLATPSASYSVWLYIHAFGKDTLFRVQNDYVAPKLAHEERRLEALTLELRDGATATERKTLAEQQTLVEELRAFLAEVKRVAPLWNPDLDDGVIINFAPLWRLVPQHKPWQKELKATWDAFCAGKYDWAHLAMHLWPERVVPKCATDRSLAIAHGLEADLWEEGADGKWRPRVVPRPELDRLIAERISPAVKDTLRNLLDAPAPAATRGGGRRSASTGGGRRAAATPRTNGGTGAPRAASPAGPDGAALESVRQAIAASGGSAGKAEVLAATGLTDAQWNLAIAALLAAGTATKTGAARGTRYHLVNVGDL